MSLFKSRQEPTLHKQTLVSRRVSRNRLWPSLALVGSNFLGNSWVKSGGSLVQVRRLLKATHSVLSDSLCAVALWRRRVMLEVAPTPEVLCRPHTREAI